MTTKSKIRLWEVVGVDPIHDILVIFNPSIKKYKDVYFSTGANMAHPSCHDVEYIYPESHLQRLEEIRQEENIRKIREE